MDSEESEGQGPELYEALGRVIQVLRTDRELDRKDLAERSGVSYSYLTAIENGNRSPSPAVLQAIAQALGLHAHELLASAESRQARGRLYARTAARSAAPARRTQAATRERRWHPEGPAPAWVSESELDQLERQLAPMAPPTRSPIGFRLALDELLPHLSASDLEMLLTLARRLAERRSR